MKTKIVFLTSIFILCACEPAPAKNNMESDGYVDNMPAATVDVNIWSFYQPLSFSIADNSSLGSKADLQELCTEADKYGISIIADIVFNHLANIDDDHLESDGTPTVSPDVEAYEPEIYAKRNASGTEATFHHNKNASGSGAITQYYAYGNLPDLNTANPVVQARSLA